LSSLDTEPFARRFAALSSHLITADEKHAAALRDSSDEELRRLVAEAAKLALSDAAPALSQFLNLDVAVQVVVPYLLALPERATTPRRLLDVRAGVGLVSNLFLRAGFAAHMFEARAEFAESLAALAEEFRGRAKHEHLNRASEPSAVFAEVAAASIAAIVREILTRELTADVLRLDITDAGPDDLPAAEISSIGAKVVLIDATGDSSRQLLGFILAMADEGYRPVVFGYRASPDNEGQLSAPDLVDISFELDEARHGEYDALALVMYRDGDTTFLAQLARTISLYWPAQARPSARAAASLPPMEG
jgi:hypothetical protein